MKAQLTCQFCGKDYFVQPYRKLISKYCSWHCGQIAKGKLAGAANIKRLRGKGGKHKYVKFYGVHEHRVVAAKKLGRALFKWEVVHHIDGDGKNNSPENLQVITQSEHMKIHLPEMIAIRRANLRAT